MADLVVDPAEEIGDVEGEFCVGDVVEDCGEDGVGDWCGGGRSGIVCVGRGG